MSNQPKTIINNDLYNYAIEYGVKEHPVLRQIREFNQTLPNGHMQIPPEQAQFMAILAKITNARKYLEIGVFTGYSALSMAIAMGSNSLIYALDNDDVNLGIAKNYWIQANVHKQINVLQGDAIHTLDNLCTNEHIGTFDIAFIDANKSDYKTYYEYCYQLVKTGGIILIDNVLMHGLVLDNNAPNYARTIHEFNQFIYSDIRVNMVMLPMADGITMVHKKDYK
ncbi:MAG: class I SAM-dependent methyltransferase [Burkholderiales bacterium]|nr:class I SAM-dependent methyltransferase [Burkholderiales bacterium]